MKTVLVVDDDVNITTFLRKTLENSGYTVVIATDGNEGLQKARDHRPHLILLDIVMPGMDGFSLLRELRADSELQGIPVVIVTVKEDMTDLFRVEGAAGVFEKPFKAEAILTKVRELIG